MYGLQIDGLKGLNLSKKQGQCNFSNNESSRNLVFQTPVITYACLMTNP